MRKFENWEMWKCENEDNYGLVKSAYIVKFNKSFTNKLPCPDF